MTNMELRALLPGLLMFILGAAGTIFFLRIIVSVVHLTPLPLDVTQLVVAVLMLASYAGVIIEVDRRAAQNT